MPSSLSSPGPSGYLCLSRELRSNPLNFYRKAWEAYGDLIRFKVMPQFDQYFAIHPDLVERVLVNTETLYRKPDLTNRPLSLLIGQGLVTSEGATWKRQRRLIQPAFHRQALANLAATMALLANEQVKLWESYPKESVINLTEEMQQLTLKIVAEALFSADLGEKTETFSKAFRYSAEFIDHRINSPIKLPIGLPVPRHQKFIKVRAILDKVALEVIQARRQQDGLQRMDLLAMLMAARDEETGEGMSDLELKDQVMTLLVAGHETVSVTLAWTFHLLSINPQALKKLEHEIETVLSGKSPTAEDAMRLPYARMVIEEALRLFPPVWGIPRETRQEDELKGYRIPKGALIIAPSYLTHRHPEFWERPEQFEPERFSEVETAKRHKYAYYPFGGGPRICIGNQFALMEATLILSALIQRFRLEPATNKPVEIDPTFTLRPKGGLQMKLMRR